MKTLFPVLLLLFSFQNAFGSAIHEAEEAAVMALVPVEAATKVAVQSGLWNDTNTWAGPLPGPADKVHIPQGLTVTLSATDHIAFWVRYDGVLRFETGTNTQLSVDTLIGSNTSHLEIGTPFDPIAADSYAKVFFRDTGPINMTWDPRLFSRGFLSFGSVTLHGTPKTGRLDVGPLVKGASLVPAGDGWQVGDHLCIPGVNYLANQDESVIISDIFGGIATVGPPLQYDHIPLPGNQLPILNLTRNIDFSSQSLDPLRRGHTMFMHSGMYDLAYAGFYNLGRTRKQVPIDDVNLPSTNRRGRYSIHLHRNHQGMPIYLTGLVAVDSPGWGLVNHSSNVFADDCITFKVFGAGIVSEAGDEIGAWRHCSAIRSTGSGQQLDSRKKIGDFGHGGHGFWNQSPGVAMIDNVASGHTKSAALMVYGKGYNEPDTGVHANPGSQDQLLAEYRGNNPFGSAWAYEFQWVQHEDNLAEDLRSWNCPGGVSIRQSNIHFINAVIKNTGGKGTGFHFVHGYDGVGDLDNCTVTGFETGVITPSIGVQTINGGTWNNSKQDFLVYMGEHGEITFRNLFDRKYTFHPFLLRRGPDKFHAATRRYFFEDGSTQREGYSETQASGFVPYTTGQFANLTNLQIQQQYGLLPLGRMAPDDAVRIGNYLVK